MCKHSLDHLPKQSQINWKKSRIKKKKKFKSDRGRGYELRKFTAKATAETVARRRRKGRRTSRRAISVFFLFLFFVFFPERSINRCEYYSGPGYYWELAIWVIITCFLE